MRTGSPLSALVGASAALLVPHWATPAGDAWFPVVHIVRSHVPTLEGGYREELWKSTAYLFNRESDEARVSIVETYNVRLEDFCGPGRELPIPGKGSLEFQPGCVFENAPILGFVHLRVPPGVAISASLAPMSILAGCSRDLPTDLFVSHGRVSLPVFDRPLPSNTPGLIGDIDLGAPGYDVPTFPNCFVSDQRHLRRVNLTLLNLGSAPATLTIRAYPTRQSGAGKTVLTADLAPGVTQFNSLPIPPSSVLLDEAANVRVWLEVLASEPLLGYVSTIIDSVDSGDIPVQVLPLRQD